MTKTKQVTVKKRKALSSLTDGERWGMLQAYMDCEISNQDIVDKFGITYKALENFIRTTYAKFQNARETKLLIATQTRPDLYESMKTKFIDSDQINQAFLDKLSNADELLTDSEILFCEFLLEYGDEVKAIEKSKLNTGLKKTTETIGSYTDACRLRSFFLKRKANIQAYINEQKKKNLSVLKDGKEFVQSNLITIIEQLKNCNDPRNLPSHLKAIESLGRTFGAFEDKVSISDSHGDDVLDRILNKAKKVNGELIELEGDTDEPQLPQRSYYSTDEELSKRSTGDGLLR